MNGLRRSVALLHRWLGIAGNLLFVVWFASALVMMYARMPALDPGDRLNRLPALDLDAVRVGPAAAAAAARLDAEDLSALQVRLGMAGDRPVWRFRTERGWTSVYADSASPLLQVSQGQALAIAASYAAGREAAAPQAPDVPLEYDAFLNRPDQWTLQIRGLLPLHRIRTGHDVLYVSDRTAEVVMKTTASSRFWATAGAVFHWLYFTPLRTHTAVWYQLIVWTASLGCVLTLSGLVIGLLRLRRRRSPYRGVLRWHHYSGLVFGVTAFTWVLSGALSMDPFGWQSGRTTSQARKAAVAGGALALDAIDLASFRAAALAISESFAPREIELFQFAGAPLALAYRPPGGSGSCSGRSYARSPLTFLSEIQPCDLRLVTIADGEPRRFGRSELMAAATAALPGSNVLDATFLQAGDAYYGDAAYRVEPRPVLRVRFDDAEATWLYLDPALGRVVHSEDRSSRVDRWLYRGLHQLDFPGFYHRRPLRDIVVIFLLLGGLFSSASSLIPAARRLRRHAMRLRPQKS